jgi:hypothetical protein
MFGPRPCQILRPVIRHVAIHMPEHVHVLNFGDHGKPSTYDTLQPRASSNDIRPSHLTLHRYSQTFSNAAQIADVYTFDSRCIQVMQGASGAIAYREHFIEIDRAHPNH